MSKEVNNRELIDFIKANGLQAAINALGITESEIIAKMQADKAFKSEIADSVSIAEAEILLRLGQIIKTDAIEVLEEITNNEAVDDKTRVEAAAALLNCYVILNEAHKNSLPVWN